MAAFSSRLLQKYKSFVIMEYLYTVHCNPELWVIDIAQRGMTR